MLDWDMLISSIREINLCYLKLEQKMLDLIASKTFEIISNDIPPFIDRILPFIYVGHEDCKSQLIHLEVEQLERLVELGERLKYKETGSWIVDPVNPYEIIGIFMPVILRIHWWMAFNDPLYIDFSPEQIVEATKLGQLL